MCHSISRDGRNEKSGEMCAIKSQCNGQERVPPVPPVPLASEAPWPPEWLRQCVGSKNTKREDILCSVPQSPAPPQPWVVALQTWDEGYRLALDAQAGAAAAPRTCRTRHATPGTTPAIAARTAHTAAVLPAHATAVPPPAKFGVRTHKAYLGEAERPLMAHGTAL